MIQLDFFEFEIRRKISMKPGDLANREASKPACCVLLTGKRMDSASVGLFREAVGGSTGKQVKIHFVRTGKTQLQEYLTYTFKQCLPVFFETLDTRSEESAPVETLYLSYSAVEVSFTDSGADNKTLNIQRHGYDLAKAESL